jgi:hypothetical protein
MLRLAKDNVGCNVSSTASRVCVAGAKDMNVTYE